MGIVSGSLLGAIANGILGLGQGALAILASFAALGGTSFVIERLNPRSGLPIAVLVVTSLIAAGPPALYYVLPAVVLVTPIALYRTLKQKYQ